MFNPDKNSFKKALKVGLGVAGLALLGNKATAQIEYNSEDGSSLKKTVPEQSLWKLPEEKAIGLDENFNPYQKQKAVDQLPPIYVSNPKDPRIKAYNDSLELYNKWNWNTYKTFVEELKKEIDEYNRKIQSDPIFVEKIKREQSQWFTENNINKPIDNPRVLKFGDYPASKSHAQKFLLDNKFSSGMQPEEIMLYNPHSLETYEGRGSAGFFHIYKKPIQPYILKEKPKVTSKKIVETEIRKENPVVIQQESKPETEKEIKKEEIRPDFFMMLDGNKYTYKELIAKYPKFLNDSVFKANFPGRERPKE